MEDLPGGTTVDVLVDLGAAMCDSSLSLDVRIEAARRMRLVHLQHPKEVGSYSVFVWYFGGGGGGVYMVVESKGGGTTQLSLPQYLQYNP